MRAPARCSMEEGSPAISVVIPAHNRAGTVRRALASVLAQTSPPAEVVVVDDCSCDGTAEVAASLGDPRIRVIRLPSRSGAQAARNAGIRAAASDWIAFLDSDDEWVPEKLAKQVEALRKCGWDPLTVVHTDCWRLDRTGGRTLWRIPPAEGDAYLRLLASAGPMFQGMLTSRSALERVGLLDEAVPSYQEWDTAIRLGRICRLVHLREPLFLYHCHAGETISGSVTRSVAGYRYVVEKHRRDIIEGLGCGAFDAHLRYCALKAMRGRAFAEAEAVLALSCEESWKRSLLAWCSRLGRSGGGPLACACAGVLYRFLSR